MTQENLTRSRRRIAAELAGSAGRQQGHGRHYMPRRSDAARRPPSTTWGKFLRTQLGETIAIDFLTMPTVTFNVLYVFFVLSLERRRILPVNVTAHPYAAWVAQQIVEAVGPDTHVVRPICDRDGIYGRAFDARAMSAPTLSTWNPSSGTARWTEASSTSSAAASFPDGRVAFESVTAGQPHGDAERQPKRKQAIHSMQHLEGRLEP